MDFGDSAVESSLDFESSIGESKFDFEKSSAGESSLDFEVECNFGFEDNPREIEKG